MISNIKPRWLGLSAGILVSLAFGLVYFAVLREPGSAFYPFAGLAFLGGPLIGGLVAAAKAREKRAWGNRGKAFLASGAGVFGIVFALFILLYLVIPQFERTSIQLPAACDGFDGSFHPPARLAYTLPDQSTGILINEDAETAVVARVEGNQAPFPTRVWIVSRTSGKILQQMKFPEDVVTAALGQGIVYIFYDKLGFLFDARTGKREENLLTLDNYGGLSESDRPVVPGASSGHWYLENSAVISSWNIHGRVVSRPHLTFNGIALGCFVSGSTNEVIRY